MTPEQERHAAAEVSVSTKKALREQLMGAKDCLLPEFRKEFVQNKIDYERRMMVSDNEGFHLQWLNKDSRVGCVMLFEVERVVN